MGGWGELHSSLLWICGIFFNFAKPLSNQQQKKKKTILASGESEHFNTYIPENI